MQYANSHSTIHLTINKGVGGKNNLLWTPYLGFNYNTYKLYRDTSANQDSPVLIDSVPTSINSYTDINPIAGVDNFYYIEVQRDSACIINAKKKGSCINSSRSNVISTFVVADINDMKQIATNISVYPNPVKESTTISYSLSKTAQIKIELCTILGETVNVLVNASQQQGEYKYQVNMNEVGLAEGVYMIKINIEDMVVNKMVMVIK